MKTKLTLICLLSAFSTMATLSEVQARQNREIGIRLHANTGSDVIFKKERKPDRYTHFRAGVSNLIYRDFGGSGVFLASVLAGFGFEKRNEIKDNLYFVSGWKLQGNASFTDDDVVSGLRLGFILGFQK